MAQIVRACSFITLALLSTLPVGVLGGNLLSTNGYSSCLQNGTVKVNALDVSYDKDTRVLNFNIAGASTIVQNVTAYLTVTAYGTQVYNNSFNPCDTGMTQLCPVPATTFASHGQQTIPQEYADKIPSIAFSIPDLDGAVKIELKGSGGQDVACIQSTVGNGNTLTLPAVTYAAAGIAAAALLMTGLTSLAAGSHPGATSSSPSFTEVIGWFQGMAMNGMLSVNYPTVYRSFTTNFAFSTGLVPWGSLQTSIDSFRSKTGGNLTEDNYEYLKNNATLVYSTNDLPNGQPGHTKRALDTLMIWMRDGTSVSINGTTANIGGDAGSANSTSTTGKTNHLVSGIEAFVEQLSIPKSNTFMTVLIIWCIIVAAIVVLILLLKVILELWSMFGKLPHYLESWRKRYWWRMAKALTSLILILYGSWTLYCVYQFSHGDSWAAQLLAGLTLGLFTLLLAGFTWRIWFMARRYKKLEGDSSKLYEDKETWIKYSLFYDSYKQTYWWIFVPSIIYAFARGCVIAGASGHGLVQTIGQLVIETLMLIVLLWFRPFNRRSGLWINLFIQIVRVLSVACILIFVEELGISQTTQTITGIVLIVVQCVLTATLAVLVAINAIIACFKENPHRRARKQREMINRDIDNLTPLDARNSLLMGSMANRDPYSTEYKGPGIAMTSPFVDPKGFYDRVPLREGSPSGTGSQRSFSRPPRYEDDDALVSRAAPMGRRTDSPGGVSRSPPRDRQPRLPSLNLGQAM